MPTYLDGILAHHRARAAGDRRGAPELAAALEGAPELRDFEAALRAREEVAVIAEVKRRSPSRGDLAPGLDPAELARRYEAGGAACLSVLTDGPHFGGSAADLVAARAACALPVLRKDFTVCEADCFDARAMGADAVLLIVAALDDDELRRLLGCATDLGLAALVEVHDETEAARAQAVGARLIGVNQRDLRTFEVDTERAVRVGAALDQGVCKVAESGVRDAADLKRLEAAGFDAVLVGEALVTARDVTAALRELRAVGS